MGIEEDMSAVKTVDLVKRVKDMFLDKDIPTDHMEIHVTSGFVRSNWSELSRFSKPRISSVDEYIEAAKNKTVYLHGALLVVWDD